MKPKLLTVEQGRELLKKKREIIFPKKNPMHLDRIYIKPLSVNKAWQGRRFKTKEYKAYETNLLFFLPAIELPPPPYEIHYIFGFSTRNADLLNPEKCLTDILCKKYKIDDRYISKMIIEKAVITNKGYEFFEFKIFHYYPPPNQQ